MHTPMPQTMFTLTEEEVQYVRDLIAKKGKMGASRHVNVSYPTFLRLITAVVPRLGADAHARMLEAMYIDKGRPPEPAPICALCGDASEPDLKRRCLPCAAVEEHLPRITRTVEGQRVVMRFVQDGHRF